MKNFRPLLVSLLALLQASCGLTQREERTREPYYNQAKTRSENGRFKEVNGATNADPQMDFELVHVQLTPSIRLLGCAPEEVKQIERSWAFKECFMKQLREDLGDKWQQAWSAQVNSTRLQSELDKNGRLPSKAMRARIQDLLGRHRIERSGDEYDLHTGFVVNGECRPVPPPDGATVSGPVQWNPEMFFDVFLRHAGNGMRPWTMDLATKFYSQLPAAELTPDEADLLSQVQIRIRLGYVYTPAGK